MNIFKKNKIKDSIKIYMFLSASVLFFSSPVFVLAQDTEDIVKRADEVSSFFEKNIPENVKTSFFSAINFLESKRLEVNSFSNNKITYLQENKDLSFSDDTEGFSKEDAKMALGATWYYVLTGLAFVSSSPLFFWGIILTIIYLIFRRFFR